MGPFQGLNFIWVIKRSEKKLGSCLAVFLQKNLRGEPLHFSTKEELAEYASKIHSAGVFDV